MNGVPVSLLAAAAVLAAVCSTAALLIFGALGAASLLPRGAPRADRLRKLAGKFPGFAWRAIRLLDSLIFVVAIVLGVIVTLLHW